MVAIKGPWQYRPTLLLLRFLFSFGIVMAPIGPCMGPRTVRPLSVHLLTKMENVQLHWLIDWGKLRGDGRKKAALGSLLVHSKRYSQPVSFRVGASLPPVGLGGHPCPELCQEQSKHSGIDWSHCPCISLPPQKKKGQEAIAHQTRSPKKKEGPTWETHDWPVISCNESCIARPPPVSPVVVLLLVSEGGPFLLLVVAD